MNTNKRLFRWIKIFILLYCLIGIIFYYSQDHLFFHPVAIATDSSYHFAAPYLEKTLEADAGTRFHIVQFTVKDTIPKGVVLYFHGNQDNIGHYAPFAPNFTGRRYEVWMPDYPGFGKSRGLLTEKILYEEALQVYKLARTKYAPNQIIIYGKSIGTGIAAQLASIRDTKMLILETPYASIHSLVNRFFWMYPLDGLLHFAFPTDSYLTKVTAPVYIFQGTTDGVFPYSNAIRLKTVLKKGDEFISIPGGSHNDLTSFSVMQQKLDSLLKE